MYINGQFLLLIVFFLTTGLKAQDEINLLIITGGHGFDREEFFAMFDRMDNLSYLEIVQPEANNRIESGDLSEFDLLLFYDMFDSISDAQKEAYLTLVQERKPMIFLHHSLVSYQDWPEFKKILGGKYHTRDSTRLSDYHHDEEIQVQVVNPQHPITAGMSDFRILDETYGHCEIDPEVVPLLRTEHPLSMPVIGWINQYLGHQIVFLQGGHGPSAFKDLNFQRILKNAIDWSLKTSGNQ